MVTKHEDHACKECNSKFASFMELLKHIAKEHFKDSERKIKETVQSENVLNEEKTEDVEKDKPFVFSESMLDEFLV